MHKLVIQAADVATQNLKRLAQLSGASRIEAVLPGVLGHQAFKLTDADRDSHDAVAAFCAEAQYDFAFLPVSAQLSHIGLLVMDMDSTLITIECIDEIADMLGIKTDIAAITARSMRGELDFSQSLTERVALLTGLDENALDRVYRERLKLMTGAETLLRRFHAAGGRTLLISGGFTFFTERLQVRLGLTRAIANVLEVVDGKLTGRVLGNIVDAQRKADELVIMRDELGLAADQVVAIGDGANDLDIIQPFNETNQPTPRRSSFQPPPPAPPTQEEDDDDDAPEAVSLTTSRQSALTSRTQQQQTAQQQRSKDKQRRQALVLGKQREADTQQQQQTTKQNKTQSKQNNKKQQQRAQQLVDAEGKITEEALIALEQEEVERKRTERAEKKRKEQEAKERALYKAKKVDEQEAAIEASRQDKDDIVAQQSAQIAQHTHAHTYVQRSIQFEPYSPFMWLCGIHACEIPNKTNHTYTPQPAPLSSTTVFSLLSLCMRTLLCHSDAFTVVSTSHLSAARAAANYVASVPSIAFDRVAAGVADFRRSLLRAVPRQALDKRYKSQSYRPAKQFAMR